MPPPRNRLVSDQIGLDVPVTTYGDCTGRTPLERWAAALATCEPRGTLFVGHNPGVFTPLLRAQIGTVITWWDGSARAHRWRIDRITQWQNRDNQNPGSGSPDEVVDFQTCLVPSGSTWLLLFGVAD